MPAAHTILYVIAGSIGCWSLSLVLRGLFTEYDKHKRQCPACGKAMPTSGDPRSAGEHDAGDREDQATDDMRCPSCGYLAERERELFKRRRCWPMVIAGAILLLLLLTPVLYVVAELTKGRYFPYGVPNHLLWGAAGVGVVCFGIFLGVWAWRGDRSRGRRRCPRCWYDMRGVPVLRCPECGRDVPDEHCLYQPRRRWRLVPVATVIVLVGLNLRLIPMTQRGGYVGAVPTTVLIALFEHLPDPFVTDGVFGAQERLSLRDRCHHEQLWGWQEHWLKWRSKRILRSGSDVRSMRLASTFIDYEDTDPALDNQLLRCQIHSIIDSSPRIRAEAGMIEVQCIPDDQSRELLKEAMPDLIRVLETTRNPWVARSSIDLLVNLGGDAAPAIPAIRRAMNKNDYLITESGAYGLLRLLPATDEAMPALFSALEGGSSYARLHAARALCDRRWEDPVVRDRLVTLIQSSNETTSCIITSMLYESLKGRDAEVYMPTILERVHRGVKYPKVFLSDLWQCRNAMGPHLPELISLLDSPAPSVRAAAASALEQLHRHSSLDMSGAIPGLRRLVEDADPKVNEAAWYAMDAIDR